MTEAVIKVASEEAALDAFWHGVADGADRIDGLKRLASVVVDRPETWDTRAIRYEELGLTSRLASTQCFACYAADRRLYRHHIIQIQHGGSNLSINQVMICHRCHGLIHPWLPRPTTVENRGFVKIGDWMERAYGNGKLADMMNGRAR